MGSATRESLASAVAALTALPGGADLATGEQLLQVGRVIGDSPQLLAALSDASAEASDRRAIVAALFGSLTENARALLGALVDGHWSTDRDLLAGVEEIGIRAIAESAPEDVSISEELFRFAAAVTSDSELELAVGSKLGSPAGKVFLIEQLLVGKASAQTVAIVSQLVQQPRGRRIGELIRFATTVVADQAGLAIATVTSAQPLAQPQMDRLIRGLARNYGRGLRVNQVLDPAIIGGLRVQIGDDVIDGSVASRLRDLRLRLAG